MGRVNTQCGQPRDGMAGKAFDLTASEFNLLDLLLRSPDRVVTKDELSEKGTGRPREAYDRSVDGCAYQ